MDRFARTQGTSATAREGGEIRPPVHRRGEVAPLAVPSQDSPCPASAGALFSTRRRAGRAAGPVTPRAPAFFWPTPQGEGAPTTPPQPPPQTPRLTIQ